MDNLIGWCHTMSNFFLVARRRWANVGPPVKKSLGQRRQPSSGRRMCWRWPDVGPTSACYLGLCRHVDLATYTYNFKIKDHLHNCFLIFKLKYQLAYFYFRQGDSAVAPYSELSILISILKVLYSHFILFFILFLRSIFILTNSSCIVPCIYSEASLLYMA